MSYAWRFSLLVFPIAAASLAYGGCSGDDSINFKGADGDGGAEGGDVDAAPDAIANDGGSPEAASDAALACPAYAGADAYCKALVAYCGRCSPQLQGCDLDNFAKCEKVSAAYSKAGRVGLVDCLGKIACVRDNGTALDRCVRDRLASATPTAAQDKVRTDVCTQCVGDDAGVTACVADFYAKPDGGPGAGTFVLEWNDAIVTGMDTACASAGPADGGDAGSVAACGTKFAFCAAAVVTASVPKDACKDGG